MRNNFVYAPSAFIVKSKLDEIGCYNEQLYFNDWDMWLRLSRKFEVVFISDYVSAYYRIINTSMTFNKRIEYYSSCFTIFFNLWKNGAKHPLVFHQMRRGITNWFYTKGKVKGMVSLIITKLFPQFSADIFNKIIASNIHRD